MTRLCTICARGGSKGVPGKNLRPLAGKPLIAHSIAQARASGLFDCIAVSSDSPEILATSKRYGADHLIERPATLATDQSAKLPAIQHAAQEVERRTGEAFDTFVDLDATAPLRTAGDIRGAVALCEAGGCDNVITGCEAHRSPYFNLVAERPDGFVSVAIKPAQEIKRRQDAPRCYDCNASIYVWSRATFFSTQTVITERTAMYEMPRERSWDIDSPLDFEIVAFLFERQGLGPAA